MKHNGSKNHLLRALQDPIMLSSLCKESERKAAGQGLPPDLCAQRQCFCDEHPKGDSPGWRRGLGAESWQLWNFYSLFLCISTPIKSGFI